MDLNNAMYLQRINETKYAILTPFENRFNTSYVTSHNIIKRGVHVIFPWEYILVGCNLILVYIKMQNQHEPNRMEERK